MALSLLVTLPIVVAFSFILAVLLLQLEASLVEQELLPPARPTAEDFEPAEHDAA
jgi:hypothetical protein